MTLTELLVGLMLLSVLVAAAFGLFRTSWLSYQNLVWQSKVNMEARRSLDDVCDVLRAIGVNENRTNPGASTLYQVTPQYSTPSVLDANHVFYNSVIYQVGTKYGQKYLTRTYGSTRLVGQFVTKVELEYEYRLPAQNLDDPTWVSVRVSNPKKNNDYTATYIAHTIYVTVTSEVAPYGNGGPTYSRRLTSAVHLRGPYNSRIPPAKYATAP